MRALLRLAVLAAASLSSSCILCSPVQCADVVCACLPAGPLAGAALSRPPPGHQPAPAATVPVVGAGPQRY